MAVVGMSCKVIGPQSGLEGGSSQIERFLSESTVVDGQLSLTFYGIESVSFERQESLDIMLVNEK